MRINNTRYVVENDNTDEKETKLFLYQDLVCVNKKCANENKIVDTVKTEMQLSND